MRPKQRVPTRGASVRFSKYDGWRNFGGMNIVMRKGKKIYTHGFLELHLNASRKSMNWSCRGPAKNMLDLMAPFKILSIFAIFRFLISGFWQFDHRNFDDFSFVGSNFCSKSIIINLISPYFVLYINFRDFSQFSIYRLVGEFPFCGYIIEYSTGPEISHRQVWNLSFLTHFRTHS